mgnify:CR=1 FL=1
MYAIDQCCQCPAVLKVAVNDFTTESFQGGAPGGRLAHQRAYVTAATAQCVGNGVADESGTPGQGDAGAPGQRTAAAQADATRRRISSAMAPSSASSCSAMKSRRALARDSLPEEVRGRERTGTSLT